MKAITLTLWFTLVSFGGLQVSAELPCPEYQLQGVIDPASGVALYRQAPQGPGGEPDYILTVDLSKADVFTSRGALRRQNPCCPLGDQGCQPAPDCLYRGSFGGISPEYWGQQIEDFRLPSGALPIAATSGAFGGHSPTGTSYEYGQITFPLRLQGALVSEGYADPEGWAGEGPAAEHRVLCIDNEGGEANICPYFRIDLPGSGLGACAAHCSHAMVSFSKDHVVSSLLRPRTFVGVADLSGDAVRETLMIFVSELSSRDYADESTRP